MPQLALQITRGMGREGEVVRLEGKRATIGRSTRCTFRLDSDIASREHAVLRLDGEAWFVEDLGSRNGTLLNGRRVQTAALRPKDVLTFGDSGIQMRIVGMDPIPTADQDGEDATRFMQISRPGGPARRGDDEVEAILVQPIDAASAHRPSNPPQRPNRPPPQQRSTPPAPPGPPPQYFAEADTTQAREKGFGIPFFWVIGLAFGLATGWYVWPVEWFPYQEVTAPLHWLLRGLSEFAPRLIFQLGEWLPRVFLGLYYMVFFFFLGRPFRRLPWLLIMIALHVAAVVLIARGI